mmetsp:Transcript_61055/g.176877  ORF Transcript_61055/g.176877 Transcript_61055/m.176877 type:complete len:281 (+) Transcript_61055:120-962(+)
MAVKAPINNVLRGVWAKEMMSVPCVAPGKWCYGLCCPCCFSYQQRHKLLDLTSEPYLCCGGSCICLQTPCSERDPWLCLEACCCTHVSILANRFMLQTRFDIRNDPCDETILSVTACINVLSSLAAMCADRETADHLRHCADLVNTCVCSCMLSQQQLELERIEEELHTRAYRGPPAHIIAVLPPVQQQMVSAAQALQQAPLIGGSEPYPVVTPGMMAQPVPPPASRQAPLLAQGRQVLVRVPQNAAPGTLVGFTAPDGSEQQVAVPADLAPGQQFVASY